MTDDLQAMSIAHQMKVANPKSSAVPWMIKSWTVQKDYTYRLSRLVAKPVAAIRSGFFAIVSAVKGMKKDGKH